MRKLRRGNNNYGCGAGILQVALGGDAFRWQKEILKKRVSMFEKLRGDEKKKYKSLFRDGLADDWSLTEEVVPILEKGLRRRLPLVKVSGRPRLDAFVLDLKENTTYLMILEEHFCIYQNGSIFDNSHYRVRIQDFRHRDNKVESFAVLDNYEILKELKPRLSTSYYYGF